MTERFTLDAELLVRNITFPGDVEPIDKSQYIRLADQSEPIEDKL